MTSAAPLDGYPAVQEYLFSLKAAGVKFGVDRMRIFSALIGHPEKAVPCIHVAGTNGKGSVSAMLEAILRESGLRTGLYTYTGVWSPVTLWPSQAGKAPSRAMRSPNRPSRNRCRN